MERRGRIAELVAPVVDRVAIGIHRAARSEGPDLLRRHGLSSAVPLIELRLGLPLRPVPLPQARAVLRYVDGPDFAAGLAAQVEAGVVAIADEAVVLTDAGRLFCADLSDVHERTADRLWSARGATLPGLADLAGRLVQAAQADPPGPAFLAWAPAYEPVDAAPGLLLFGRLCALRYHRADAHAVAWTEAGFTVAQVQALPPGPVRDAIEVRTDELAAAPYAALTESERLTLLAGLGALPN